jgi:hypothetical protein
MRRGLVGLALFGIGAAAGGVAAYRRVFVPWYEGWGVDPGDDVRLLPGDELVASATGVDTRAIPIDAPAGAIWPWLVQMGLGRAGWYSYDAIDMRGRSSEAIVPEWQAIAVGQTMPAWQGGGFEVAQIDPDRALVLYLDDEIVARQEAEARAVAADGVGAEPMPPGLAASAAILRTQPRRFRASWAFVLDPVDGGRTRLIERFRIEYPEAGGWSRVTSPLLGIGVFLMTRRQMLGVKRRAERLTIDGSITPAAEERLVETGHQELVPA